MVPLDYLRWLVDNASRRDSDLRQAIQDRMKKNEPERTIP
jgi:hypothetical protein